MNGFWALAEMYFDQWVSAHTSYRTDESSERYKAFIERASRAGDGADLFTKIDGRAHIPVVGVLSKEPDFFFSVFGGGSAVFGDITRAVRAADQDPTIEKIILEIDSPGGELSGLFETAAAISGASTPTQAQVTDMAASGAFALASATDEIVVNNPLAMVGSIGVVTDRFISDNRVRITSTNAPNKAPDASTEEGVASIKAELDALHEEFASIIATGRGTTVAKVNEEFGRGGLVIARDALQAGMIDGISTSSEGGVSTGSKTQAKGNKVMDLEKLKAEHPAVYQQVLALGVSDGIAKERDRVAAHATRGSESGCSALAFGFIADGSDYTAQTVQAKYDTVTRNSTDATERAADDEDANTQTDKGDGAEKTKAEEQAVKTNALFDTLESDYGISRNS